MIIIVTHKTPFFFFGNNIYISPKIREKKPYSYATRSNLCIRTRVGSFINIHGYNKKAPYVLYIYVHTFINSVLINTRFILR